MSVLEIAPAVPDLRVPRAHPCEALGMKGQPCGATPTAECLKACACTNDHARPVWLCGVHEAMVTAMSATCRDCAELGSRAHRCPVAVIRVAALTA